MRPYQASLAWFPNLLQPFAFFVSLQKNFQAFTIQFRYPNRLVNHLRSRSLQAKLLQLNLP